MELLELEAIKQLKYRYFRCLDSKQWGPLADTLTEDATAAYDNGKYSYAGRAAIMEFLEGSLGDHEIISMHMGHHPEISLTGEGEAQGTWYLEDYVIFQKMGFKLRGAGFYHDTYRKEDGVWKICKTGYVRTFEETLNLGEDGGPGAWKLTHYGDHLASES